METVMIVRIAPEAVSPRMRFLIGMNNAGDLDVYVYICMYKDGTCYKKYKHT